MVLNTITVSAAVTPTVIETYFSHYIKRKNLHQKPTAHISYHEGLQLVRQFLNYASSHTVEEIQAFTSQWVPVPQWVKVDVVEISAEKLTRAASLLHAQLGPEGIEQVGGKSWWQWRRNNSPLKAEWIEMKKDYYERKKLKDEKGTRIMLYIHGGAYYFGSVDEHRYQLQRHARKLRARVLAPRYRLSPQFPFPCGLQDALAAYLHLIETHDPSTIILAGDSAGGGMVVSALVTLRDQGVPLPAGAILISPWVDLTHSFPSLGEDGSFDYIPSHGFVHKPSRSWPPLNADDLLTLEKEASGRSGGKPSEAGQIDDDKSSVPGNSSTERPESHPYETLKITIDGKLVEIKDQIQLYAPNHLLAHPLVSPVLQPSLGGLPPLFIQVGGGELLRDEQIYLAHKAASPLSYQPAPSAHTPSAEQIALEAGRHRPTHVQLQVWDHLCHVAPTLSFTRPAKYMYRAIAQFGAWALARAQRTTIDIPDDDDFSVISSGSSSAPASPKEPRDGAGAVPAGGDGQKTNDSTGNADTKPRKLAKAPPAAVTAAVGRAGDPLPPFERHMIRQRVDRNGLLFPLPPASSLPALQLPASSVGAVKEGPVRKWLAAQARHGTRFARESAALRRARLADLRAGRFEGPPPGERPPPSALAGRRLAGEDTAAARKKRSWGMSLWSVWGSKHDEATIEREERAEEAEGDDRPEVAETDAAGTTTTKTTAAAAGKDARPDADAQAPRRGSRAARAARRRTDRPPPTSRSRSHRSGVTDQGQAIDGEEDDDEEGKGRGAGGDAAERAGAVAAADTLVPRSNTHSARPTRGGVAYPFKLRLGSGGGGGGGGGGGEGGGGSGGGMGGSVNASMLTLNSTAGAGLANPGGGALGADDGAGAGRKSGGDGVVETAAGGRADGEVVRQEGEGGNEAAAVATPVPAAADVPVERPGAQRFVTAREEL